MEKNHHAPIRDYLSVSRYAGTKDFPVVMPEPARLIKDMPYIGLHHPAEPSEYDIEQILHKMGKTRPED